MTGGDATAKSLQSCLTLCDPIDSSPPGSPVPGILQARIVEWVAISFSNACMHAKSLQSCLTLQPQGQQPTRFLCPQDSPGKNTGVCCHFLLPRRRWGSGLSSQAEIVNSSFLCLLFFYSFIQASNRLNGSYLFQGQPSALLSVLVQMLISARSTLTNIPRNNI